MSLDWPCRPQLFFPFSPHTEEEGEGERGGEGEGEEVRGGEGEGEGERGRGS